MIRTGTPATVTVRGFQTPSVSGDEGSDQGDKTPRIGVSDAGSPPRGRQTRPSIINDVVSTNCSPVMKAAPSPAVSGIAKLRQQMEPFSLDTPMSSRASSMSRGNSLQGIGSPLARPHTIKNGLMRDNGLGFLSKELGRPQSRDGSVLGSDETASQGSSRTLSYEINLEHDFVSESAPDRIAVLPQPIYADSLEGGLARPRKMTSDDFEPLRCLGKGTYGTVLLVKQRTTGKLYAQKQFKKASLVVHKKLVEQTKTERQILESVNRHPFVVKLYYAFQDQEKLYLILEYGSGGELFTHLSSERMFSEPTAAFYIAEMVLALSHLHDHLGVIYRDLKPENILLDSEGHLLLTDFGLSAVATDDASCSSMLGTVEYMAPEVIKGEKYGKAVDWWSLGALAYDLLTGSPPFKGGNHAKIQQNIIKQKLSLPFFLSADAKDILCRLLRKEPAKRLGSHMPKDLALIKKHRFFRKIDWKKLEARELEPPIMPMITDPELAENFAAEFTDLNLSPLVSPKDPWSAVAATGAELFGGFSFVASNSLLESNAFPFAQQA